MCYDNGDFYEGSFKENRKDGKGKYVWADGDVYEGIYVDDKRTDDNGKITLGDGTCFRGIFRNDHIIAPSPSKR